MDLGAVKTELFTPLDPWPSLLSAYDHRNVGVDVWGTRYITMSTIRNSGETGFSKGVA